MLLKPKRRKLDDYGEGHFGASRGGRSHKGEDFCAEPNDIVCSHIEGVVTKLGYPYADDLSFRYVEIKDENCFYHRYFYVSPLVSVGEKVLLGEEIGLCQDSGKRYNKNGKTITNHVHYEVVAYEKGKKVFHNPNMFLLEAKK